MSKPNFGSVIPNDVFPITSMIFCIITSDIITLTIIEITNSKVEANRNVLCEYKILQTMTQEELDKIEKKENKELKEAV